MGANKRCAASGRALKVESAASEIQRVKIYLRKNFAKSRQMHARKLVCGDEFATSSKLIKVLVKCSAHAETHKV